MAAAARRLLLAAGRAHGFNRPKWNWSSRIIADAVSDFEKFRAVPVELRHSRMYSRNAAQEWVAEATRSHDDPEGLSSKVSAAELSASNDPPNKEADELSSTEADELSSTEADKLSSKEADELPSRGVELSRHLEADETFLSEMQSLRTSMLRLRTSLLVTGSAQLLTAIYISYAGYAAGKLFFRFIIFVLVLPLTLAYLLPVRTFQRLLHSETATQLELKLIQPLSSYFRKADVVIGLSALGLLAASMYEMFYGYVAGSIMEAGNDLEKLAKEDLERLASGKVKRT